MSLRVMSSLIKDQKILTESAFRFFVKVLTSCCSPWLVYTRHVNHPSVPLPQAQSFLMAFAPLLPLPGICFAYYHIPPLLAFFEALFSMSLTVTVPFTISSCPTIAHSLASEPFSPFSFPIALREHDRKCMYLVCFVHWLSLVLERNIHRDRNCNVLLTDVTQITRIACT